MSVYTVAESSDTSYHDQQKETKKKKKTQDDKEENWRRGLHTITSPLHTAVWHSCHNNPLGNAGKIWGK